MSAPNFNCRPNTKKIYAFCLSEDYEKYCEDDREQMADDPDYDGPIDYEYWYDDEKEYFLDWIREELKATFGDLAYMGKGRIYDGDPVAKISIPFTFANSEWPVEIALRFHAGYYEGFSLDWDITKILYDYADIFPDEKDCIDALTVEAWNSWSGRYELSGINSGLAKILAPKMVKRLQAALDDTTDRLEAVLEKVATHKWHGACMSNGEGIYWDAA